MGGVGEDGVASEFGGEAQVAVVRSELFDRFSQVARPAPRVANLGSTRREEVVQVVSGVLRQAQRTPVREVKVHFGRRLSAGGDLEDDPHAVEGFFLAGVGDVQSRCDQADVAR